MDKYQVHFKSEYWECGDGCCQSDTTTITINDIEIGHYADLSSDNFDGLELFLSILNENDQALSFTFTAETDEDGELRDAIYLNDTRITCSYWASEMYLDIFNKLQLPYRYRAYDVNWYVWGKEKKLVLQVEEDEVVLPT